MTRHSQRHRTTVLPFSYRDKGVDFELDSYTVDDGNQTALELNPAQTEIDLASAVSSSDSSDDPDWNTITLHGKLGLSEETVQAVFPQDERAQPPAKLYVTIRCHETIYRDRVVISEAPTTPGEYDVTIEVPKSTVRGTFELRPYLVRTESHSGEGLSDYADQKNFRVASGTLYYVVVDRTDGEERAAIDGERVRFSQNAHLPDGNKLYYLDFRNESRPKLWINSDHPRIAEVLQSRGSVGAEARMRDVILDQVSYGVWIQLLVRAGSAVDVEGDVEYEWQEMVLQTFARNLYDTSDVSEATHRLRDNLSDSQTLPHVIQRIDSELQEYINPREQLIHLMEEGLQI
ncbi:hypothetical protein [Natrarchaeobaculum sulfurireducens]|uniref:Uncharacterized protein n=1 Tax=Natrarchaeobaculum sulfurireducens TaxID=2044521 RepID=A0A346PJD3_9EURY|nr:hypothetical protein [Natrarchaeobaculum sulfurireducens]AXR79628.1 hypothetical protein AArc1_3328 [Natrarchaeobaculum sulfurireducens]